MFGRKSKRSRAASDPAALLASALTAVSHEIRTPLTTMMGVLRVLNESDLAPHQRRLMDTAERAGRRLEAWIDNMADFIVADTEPVTLTQAPFNVTTELQLAAELAGAEDPQGAAEIILDVAPELGQARLGDARRLRQLCFNMLDGVAQSVVGGVVRARARLRDDDVFAFTVRHAPGAWDPERRDTALRILVEGQTDGVAARRDGGAALALATAARIARWMGGALTARPDADENLVLEFTTPLPPAPPRPRDESAEALTQRAILVAEDNVVNQKLIQVLLEGLGCHVMVVASGEEVLDAVDDYEFDLILMDLHMPGLDGFAAAEAVRARGGAAAATPIVALTADVAHDVRLRAQTAGMADFVKKPIDVDELSDVIERHAPSAAAAEAAFASGSSIETTAEVEANASEGKGD